MKTWFTIRSTAWLAVMVVIATAPAAWGQATGPAVAGQSAAVDVPADDTQSKDADAKPQATQMPAAAGERSAVRFDFVAGGVDDRIARFLEQMTLEEKIGQLVQVYPDSEQELTDALAAQVRNGEVGSVFYPGNREVVAKAQRIAIEESRLGIPLLIARDVVHGLRTIFPIPLGQAATWNPELVEKAAAVAADEARAEAIDWTFAPMVDISRDARWGRIAETLGEDPRLAGELAAAMVRGFQQERDGQVHGVIACAKHFAGYGFSEGGRDYNRVSVSPVDLHNIVLPSFQQSVDAGCRTLMTSFSDVNGVPATGHRQMLRGVLKSDWGFKGFVVSDWASVTEMVVHGFAEDNARAAEMALHAGVDMDMCSFAYRDHLAKLIRSGRISEQQLNDAVRRVLRCKIDIARSSAQPVGQLLAPVSLEIARETARQSMVLLKNDKKALPLDESSPKRIAVIGPLADAPRQQLGCWSLDGRAEDSITPLADLRERLGEAVEIDYVAGAKNSFAEDASGIAAAVEAAGNADIALLFVGEDAVLSGEARCRVSLDLPGVQSQLVREVAATGTPTIVVVIAGRPLAIGAEVEVADAVLFGWHPGTMTGPAINDLLFGDAAPSGKLPVTFPRSVGQTPIYYNHTNTGRPSPAGYRPLVGLGTDDLPPEHQYKSHYLDAERGPLFPFGFGLTYTTFEYSGVSVSAGEVLADQGVTVAATVTNTGEVTANEVVQLYLRDLTSSIVRPVRELKGFERVRLEPGESRRVEFRLEPNDLGYRVASGRMVIEPGRFQVGIGGDSTVELAAEFRVARESTLAGAASRERVPTAISSKSPVH